MREILECREAITCEEMAEGRSVGRRSNLLFFVIIGQEPVDSLMYLHVQIMSFGELIEELRTRLKLAPSSSIAHLTRNDRNLLVLAVPAAPRIASFNLLQMTRFKISKDIFISLADVRHMRLNG